jgi:acetyl esterase/lipase
LPNSKYVENKEIVPLQDAQRAIQLVRENAKKWGINPNKIGIEGNSAGGHLASTAGTHYQKSLIDNPLKTSLRPDFMVLNYPVISMADSLTHLGSRDNLIGEALDASKTEQKTSEQKSSNLPVTGEKIKEYSNELQVTSDTPPTFITHAVDDDAVKVQNSLLFIAALQKNKVPVESFFYAKGGHGYAMDNPTSDVEWIDSCMNWILKINK